MMISEGSGMQALSMPMSSATPPYPMVAMTAVVHFASASMTAAITQGSTGPSAREEDLVVRTAAVGLGLLGVQIAPAAVVAEPGAEVWSSLSPAGGRGEGRGGPGDPVLRLERHLPAAAGQFDGEVGHGEPARVAPRLLQDLHPAGERRAQVRGALGDVAL